jgi:hypothetical protein
MTFEEQSRKWIEQVQARRRRPVRLRTARSWRSHLNWIVPRIGSLELGAVNNKTVKGLVEQMAAAGLSPKTVANHLWVVKAVVASAVGEDG